MVLSPLSTRILSSGKKNFYSLWVWNSGPPTIDDEEDDMLDHYENQVIRPCPILGEPASSGVFGVWVWYCGPSVQEHSKHSLSANNTASLVLGQASTSGVSAVWTWNSGSDSDHEEDEDMTYTPEAIHRTSGKWVWNSGTGSYYDDENDMTYKVVASRQEETAPTSPLARNEVNEKQKNWQVEERDPTRSRAPKIAPRKAALVSNEQHFSPIAYRRLRKRILAESRIVREYSSLPTKRQFKTITGE
jgi:hypothetical protein